MRLRVLSAALFLLLASLISASAAPEDRPWTLTATCESPKGPRIDFSGSKEAEESRDGFKGVNPVFILSSEAPQVLLVLWEDTHDVPEKLRETGARRAVVVERTENRITAVETETGPNRGTWMYTLFPSLHRGVFTRHSEMNLGDVTGSGVLLVSACKFDVAGRPDR